MLRVLIGTDGLPQRWKSSNPAASTASTAAGPGPPSGAGAFSPGKPANGVAEAMRYQGAHQFCSQIIFRSSHGIIIPALPMSGPRATSSRAVALLLLGMSLASWIVILVKALDIVRNTRSTPARCKPSGTAKTLLAG